MVCNKKAVLSRRPIGVMPVLRQWAPFALRSVAGGASAAPGCLTVTPTWLKEQQTQTQPVFYRSACGLC